MITNPQKTAATAKAKKRSVFGLLFNPQLGSSISPLRESTRIFVHLVASVFSIYKLIPKDYPGLRDQETRLSFGHILRTGWSNIRFTREGAPQAIIFFAVVGVMVISTFAVISTFLSLFIGHAHAQASMFQPESSDLGQAWLDYLFNNPTGGTVFATHSDTYSGDNTVALADPFQGGHILQQALMTALGFYSDAILVVAAIILFYHLASMVVETAHHGVPMGKRASQIWAPIRLVFAIGLLVPVNGGLSCGQYIVVKMAELGGGMASQAWDLFLTQMASSTSTAVPPPAGTVENVGADVIRMLACRESWNYHIQEFAAGGVTIAQMPMPTGTAANIGGMTGTKYSFSSNALGDLDVCGWYFVPNGTGNTLLQSAIDIQTTALTTSVGGEFQAAADKIQGVFDAPLGQTQTPIHLDATFANAVGDYQKAVTTGMAGLIQQQQGQISSTIATMKPYGWVMAGAFMNTIDRMQASLAAAANDSMIKTSPPQSGDISNKGKPEQSWLQKYNPLDYSDSQQAWDVRKKVAQDMAAFDHYQIKAISDNSNVQCAAMLGLSAQSSDGATTGFITGAIEYLFGAVDHLATLNGVWSAGTGATVCGGTTPATFKLGVQFGGTDPFSAMSFLGHANIKTAFDIAAVGAAASAVSGIASLFAGANPLVGLAGGIVGAAAPLAFFLALIFWTTGFILAFMIPLMPFMRFFFAVLSWVAGVFEAIIAVPLIALAHLNPEGEGLPGQAKTAYFYVFNLFLRPVLTVFGLLCGLILFLVALSFLNYAYAIAVAGAGGTAFGLITMEKLLYSILYVAILYICANHAFQLIDHIPQQALTWMGSQGQGMAKMGDVDRVESFGTAAAGYMGAQALSNIRASATKAHEANVGYRSNTKALENAGAEQKRHQEILGALGRFGGAGDGAGDGGGEGGQNYLPQGLTGGSGVGPDSSQSTNVASDGKSGTFGQPGQAPPQGGSNVGSVKGSSPFSSPTLPGTSKPPGSIDSKT